MPAPDQTLEVTLDERPTCPRCGTPMNAGTAVLCGGRRCEPLELPPTCPSRACRQARDEEAIANAIASGLIDP